MLYEVITAFFMPIRLGTSSPNVTVKYVRSSVIMITEMVLSTGTGMERPMLFKAPASLSEKF